MDDESRAMIRRRSSADSLGIVYGKGVRSGFRFIGCHTMVHLYGMSIFVRH